MCFAYLQVDLPCSDLVENGWWGGTYVKLEPCLVFFSLLDVNGYEISLSERLFLNGIIISIYKGMKKITVTDFLLYRILICIFNFPVLVDNGDLGSVGVTLWI